MSRGRQITIIIALLVVIAVAFVWWQLSDGAGETVEVIRGDLDVTIETVGRLTLSDEVVIRSEIDGQVEALGASAGESVQAGEILVLLNSEPLQEAIADAERTVERAEFALQAAEELAEQEDTIENRLAVVEADGTLDAAERALERAREALSDAAILAPDTGTVLAVLVRPGDIVGRAQPVARLMSPDSLHLVADVDELDLPNVKTGAEVTFRVDSYPATEISGAVVDTSPTAEQRGGATVFPTTIRFDVPPDLDLRPGMNADVTIVTDARKDILLLPDRAIRTVGERSFVELIRDDAVEEVEVVTGFRSGGMIEIVAGLEEGQRVRVP